MSAFTRIQLFFTSLLLSLCALIAIGMMIAWLIVPAPLNYHRTKYFEFSLPDNWYCEKAGYETVCNSTGAAPHNAIIILAIKYRNEEDNLDAYRDHLLKSRTFTTREGVVVNSSVKSVEEKRIGNYFWVDGTHFESEVPGFYTRYLVTTTAQLGIAITFSYGSTAPQSIIDEFSSSIAGLRIYQAPSIYR